MFRRLLASVFLALALLAILAAVTVAQGTGAQRALAQGDTKQVAVVIGLPDNKVHAEIVTVPVTATAFDALQSASVKLVSTTGDFGPAVCSIDGTGCPSTNCFCDKNHFWAYYHLDPASGKWVAAQEGAGAYKPADGAVEGFVWSGVDASFNATDQPPLMTFLQVQAQAGGQAAGASATPAVSSSLVTTATTSAPPAALPATGGAFSPVPLPGIVLLAAGLLAAGLVMRRRPDGA